MWSMPKLIIGCASGYAESTGSKAKGINRYPDQYLYEDLGLVRLPGLTREPAVGEGMSACPRAGCVKCASPVR